MPELPEVETIKRGLSPIVVGAKITDAKFLWSNTLKEISEAKFKKKVLGKTITNVDRRAKNLIITLSSNKYLLLHMKMTGHLLVEPDTKEVDNRGNWVDKDKTLNDSFNQYIRAILWLDNGKIIAFSDLRKFGYIKLVDQKELDDFLSDYGPEPFSKGFNREYLKSIFKRKNIAVKKALMDQSIIAGVGNIYADEILWRAKIHPLTPTSKLSREEIDNIIDSTKMVLKKAIDRKGTSVSDFRNVSGRKGNYDQELVVYKKDGERCPRDNAIIKRIKVGGRGTHFCPKEQRQK